MALIVPDWLPQFGKPEETKKGMEDFGLESFFNKLRTDRPHFALLATHVQNEKIRTYQQAQADKLKGMVPGWVDITLVSGAPTFMSEMKVIGGKWQKGQLDHMKAAQEMGAFVSLSWGAKGAWEAFLYWEKTFLLK